MTSNNNNTANDSLKAGPLNNVLLDVLAQKSSWQLLGKSVQRKACHCQNYNLDGRFIIKLFRFPENEILDNTWWIIEHTILSLINGKWGSPISHGYLSFNQDTYNIVIFVRERISGNTLEESNVSILNNAQCKEVGELLANFHNDGIVTRDCTLGNLLLNTDNTLCFIDFGKARSYKNKTLLFFFQAGWDCWKAQWRCAKLEPRLCEIMMNAYWAKLDTNKYTRALYNLMQKITRRQQLMRLKKRGKLPDYI